MANAVAALSEIGDTSGRDVMEIDTSVLQKLLAALNECTEWGQVETKGMNRGVLLDVILLLLGSPLLEFDEVPSLVTD